MSVRTLGGYRVVISRYIGDNFVIAYMPAFPECVDIGYTEAEAYYKLTAKYNNAVMYYEEQSISLPDTDY